MSRSIHPPFLPAGNTMAALFGASAPSTEGRTSPSLSSSLAALLGSSIRPPAASTPPPSASPLAAFFQVPGAIPTPSLASRRQWVAVRQRFEQFAENLTLTRPQVDDGVTKCQGVVRCLTREYYGEAVVANAAFTIGSWGKNTAIRPPRDIDLYFVLPATVHTRFEAYSWNRQSALLQEVKNVLAATYPSTEMRGDGQVVVVSFESYAVEVVPAFLLTNGRYWICDTHDGGRYRTTDPVAERAKIEAIDAANGRNLRPLVCMLKAWQGNCSVPIASFALELVAAEFLAQSPWRLNDFFYFDWLIRDFFVYLYSKVGQTMILPGTGEAIPLGDDWRSRVVTAYGRAADACNYERDNLVCLAGEEWQKVFGRQISTNP